MSHDPLDHVRCDLVGNIDYAEAHEGYMGKTTGLSVSAETKQPIESEVKGLIDEGYQLARKVILDKAEEFERLAKGLLEYETLTGDEIRKVVAGEALGGGDSGPPPPAGGVTASILSIPKTKPRARKGGLEPKPLA